MNVVFLDYDGVVNTPMWDASGKHCKYNSASDNKVNNFQAVQWVSEFCQKYKYGIVVTSTWRYKDNYKDCLINGGLRDGIPILGKTPYLFNRTREFEIQMYLDSHPEIENFLIFDDDLDMGELRDHLIKTNTTVGFTLVNYESATKRHQKLAVYDEVFGKG
jgi:hypothetical protein